MIDATGRFRCDRCGRFLAERWPYHKCHDCQERQIARGRLMASMNERLDALLERAEGEGGTDGR